MGNIENSHNLYNVFLSNTTFGSRLKACRKISNKTQEDIVIEILQSRELLQHTDSEKSDINFYLDIKKGSVRIFIYESEEHRQALLKIRGADFIKKVDKNYERLANTERAINSTRCNYRDWEKKDSNNIDIVFSMNNLRILKNIYNCDYSFLLCETDFPHKNTERIFLEIGLLPYTIEKLTMFSIKSRESDKNIYRYLLHTIDIICQSDTLLHSLEDFFLCFYEDELSFRNFHLSKNDAINIFTKKVAFSLQFTAKNNNLKSLYSPCVDNTPTILDKSFGARFKALMGYRKIKPKELATIMYNYESSHNLNPPLEDSILKTIQNWRRKDNYTKDTKLNLGDFGVIKELLHCDYEYLFGECDSIIIPNQDTSYITGLMPDTIEILKFCNKRTERLNSYTRENKTPCITGILDIIDILLTSDRLLLFLCLFLTDLAPTDDEIDFDQIICSCEDESFKQYCIKYNCLNPSEYILNVDLKELLLDEIFEMLNDLHAEHFEYILKKI